MSEGTIVLSQSKTSTPNIRAKPVVCSAVKETLSVSFATSDGTVAKVILTPLDDDPKIVKIEIGPFSNIPVTRVSHLSDKDLDDAIGSNAFKYFVDNWNKNLDTKLYDMKSITILDVMRFGPNVGFLILEVNILSYQFNAKTNQIQWVPLPKYAFVRANAGTILPILINEEIEEEYIILVEQFRVPGGDLYVEGVAGMKHDVHKKILPADFVMKELKEEAGIDFGPNVQVVNLTRESRKTDKFLGEAPSIGGCNELIDIHMAEVRVSSKTIDSLSKKRKCGVFAEGEFIHTLLVPVSKVLEYTNDMKVLSGLFLREKYHERMHIKNTNKK